MQIDWAVEWTKKRERDFWSRQLKKKGISSTEYYDNCPAELAEAHFRYVHYPGLIFEKMQSMVTPGVTVLDIGAGDGAFTIPFAKIAKRVTVVEPSLGQIGRLVEKAKREGLDNIEIINARWEELQNREIASYDVVVAAYSFSMPDIKNALQKMFDHTSGVLFLVTSAGNGFTGIYQDIFDNAEFFTDNYIYLYNILHQMGIQANVHIITRKFIHPWDLMLSLLKLQMDINPDLERRLFEVLKRRGQFFENGELWVKSWHKDALIWHLKEAS